MSQHDFNIGNQLFPATRTDLNNALVALASNSSGASAPSTTYANQFWYETDTNKLKIRNEANSDWIEIATLDQSGNSVQSITTAGLTLGSTAISATGSEINQLDAITRGSILYGNPSGATARLSAGNANTILKSDGTDIFWAASPTAATTLTRGQIIYGNPSGTTAALSPGAANQVLTSDGQDISWAQAGSNISTTLGAVDTYAFLRGGVNSTVGTDPGATRAGSTLVWSDTEDNYETSPALSGTWRCMGHHNRFASSTLFLRIS